MTDCKVARYVSINGSIVINIPLNGPILRQARLKLNIGTSCLVPYPVSLCRPRALRGQLGGQDVVLVVVQVGVAPLLLVVVAADVEAVLVVAPPATAGGGGDVCRRCRARRGVPHA